MKSSIQIHNELLDLDNRIEAASREFAAAEGDAKDALRDSINQYKGEQKSLNDMLGDVLAAEDEVRRGGGIPLAGGTAENVSKPRTTAEMLLGPRDQFKGLDFGQMLKLDVNDASDKPYTNFSLPGIEEIDYNLERQTSDAAYQYGFLNSLPKATTKADTLKYFAKNPDAYKNAAATWTPGAEKPSTTMGWVEQSASVETIAHLMPVLEQQVKDWGQLRQLIDVELLNGLLLVEAQKALTGSNANGITGVLNNASIQKATKATTDDVVDTIRKMKTDVLLNSNFAPTHLAVHPYVAESLELMKDKNGRYIQQVINGKLWALTVVEDINLMTAASDAKSSATYGALVYWNNAATWFTKENDSIQVGLVGNQFAYNEATIRAEGRHALKVTYPKAFSYLADTGVSGR